MSDERLYTLRQISQELELPESTVRYYRDSFSQYLPTVGTGRRRRYPERAVAVLRVIAEAYSQNRSRDEIENYLESTHAEAVEAEPFVGYGDRQESRKENDGESIGRYIEEERGRRDALWHIAREIVRLGEVIDRQGVMLGELAQQISEQANRALPTPPQATPATPPPQPTPAASTPHEPPRARPTAARPTPQPQAPQPTPAPAPAHPAPAEPVPAATASEPEAAPRVAAQMAAPPAVDEAQPATEPEPGQLDNEPEPVQPPADAAETPPVDGDIAHQLESLREQLARERELVERLRRSKMEVERRAAEAESRLGYGSEPPIPRQSRKSMFTRFFNQG